jgi:hypothetical protein
VAGIHLFRRVRSSTARPAGQPQGGAIQQLAVGAPVWTAQAEADLHQLGRRVAQALGQEPATWAAWPV